MKSFILPALFVVFSVFFSASSLHAAEKDKMNHDAHKHHNHSEMKAAGPNKTTSVKGVVNKIDAEGKQLNVTHEPVEALGWPKMTMDLPVTSKVDLKKIKEGDKVEFMLKQGRDKKFRIIEIETVK